MSSPRPTRLLEEDGKIPDIITRIRDAEIRRKKAGSSMAGCLENHEIGEPILSPDGHWVIFPWNYAGSHREAEELTSVFARLFCIDTEKGHAYAFKDKKYSKEENACAHVQFHYYYYLSRSGEQITYGENVSWLANAPAKLKVDSVEKGEVYVDLAVTDDISRVKSYHRDT